MLRIATFNMENLFSRPTAMSGDTDAVGREALGDSGSRRPDSFQVRAKSTKRVWLLVAKLTGDHRVPQTDWRLRDRRKENAVETIPP